jgi:hypothetical protein
VKLTAAQIENLRHVERFGEAKPRSRSGYWCRRHGLSEFVWLRADGALVGEADLAKEPRPIPEDRQLVKVVGERLTEAGRSALSLSKEG